jgi:hypothetical protein
VRANCALDQSMVPASMDNSRFVIVLGVKGVIGVKEFF